MNVWSPCLQRNLVLLSLHFFIVFSCPKYKYSFPGQVEFEIIWCHKIPTNAPSAKPFNISVGLLHLFCCLIIKSIELIIIKEITKELAPKEKPKEEAPKEKVAEKKAPKEEVKAEKKEEPKAEATPKEEPEAKEEKAAEEAPVEKKE